MTILTINDLAINDQADVMRREDGQHDTTETAPRPSVQAQTFRHHLRRATRLEHDATEAVFQRFMADPAAHMSWFLSAQWAGLSALRDVAPSGGPSGTSAQQEQHQEYHRASTPLSHPLLQDLCDRLREDCSALGLHPVFMPALSLDPLATDYIVLGSRLGTEVIRRHLVSDGHHRLPSYFDAPDATPLWRRHCLALNDVQPETPRAARICADAKRGFALFARAATAQHNTKDMDPST